jgi:membrane-bound metal-dependent hydrolase YbcI (DUF457 family)
MDSLTQIVLGAAVGEAVLGRKVGNRAMLWGGIAGTLPDLDVMANAVSDPMSALAYHRAFTHSLPFAFLAAPIIGLAIHRLYGGSAWKDKVNNWVLFPLLILAFYAMLTLGSLLMPVEIKNIPAITAAVSSVFVGICLVVALFRWIRGSPKKTENADWRGWSLLFFWAIVTHPLLDCFTAYGTQLLEPISKHRVAWNTISVADPMYTLPFLILLVWARTQVQGSAWRQRLNRAGLVVSSVYLGLTIINFFNVDHVFQRSLSRSGINAEERIISPSILNNILWSGTARTKEDHYYFGQYSLLDKRREFDEFTPIEGNHEWLAPYAEDRDVAILRWFTQGFYGVVPRDSGYLQVNDLRYGLINEDPRDPASYIFSWKVDTSVHPVRVVREFAGPQENQEDLFGRLWERLKGQ